MKVAMAIGAAILFVLAASLAGAAPGDVTRYAGDGNLVPGENDPVDRLDLDLLTHSTTTAPNGVVFIADFDRDVVYRVGLDDIVIRVAGTGVRGAGPESGVATEIDLNGPWGLDVDRLGNVYFAEFANDRIRKLLPTGQLETVAYVAHPVEVKVAGLDRLYVATKENDETHPGSGVWKVDIDTSGQGTATRILSDVDSAGIALAADGTLWVAASVYQNGFVMDAYLCEMDPDVPEVCTRRQRQAYYADHLLHGAGVPVGPQLSYVELTEPSGCYLNLVLQPDLYTFPYVADVEIDSSGLLHLLFVMNYPGFKRFEPGSNLSETVMFGGTYPAAYVWDPEPADPPNPAIRYFGKELIDSAECFTLEDTFRPPLENGTPGIEALTAYGNGISLTNAGDLHLNDRASHGNGLQLDEYKKYTYSLERLDSVPLAGRVYFPLTECGDGIDNDGDGDVDWGGGPAGEPPDPACNGDPDRTLEGTQCDDDDDNDLDDAIDWDGGPGGEPADPECVNGTDNKEHEDGCGLGVELALLLPLVTWLHRRRRCLH